MDNSQDKNIDCKGTQREGLTKTHMLTIACTIAIILTIVIVVVVLNEKNEGEEKVEQWQSHMEDLVEEEQDPQIRAARARIAEIEKELESPYVSEYRREQLEEELLELQNWFWNQGKIPIGKEY